MRLSEVKQKSLKHVVEQYVSDMPFNPTYEVNIETIYNLSSCVEIELDIKFRTAKKLVIRELEDLDFLVRYVK
jgi:hypothetical protein